MWIVDIILLLLIILLIDAIFLYIIHPYLKQLSGQDFVIKPIPAILIYIVLAIGIYYFIVSQNKSFFDAGLLGLFTYSIYELTNIATLNGWTIYMVLIDSLWGFVSFATTTLIFNHIKMVFFES